MLGHGGSSAGSYLAVPHPLALCCNYPVSKCPSASIVATSTVRVKSTQVSLFVDRNPKNRLSYNSMWHVTPNVACGIWFCFVLFMLFHDTWSQLGHSVSCMTILFLTLQITRSDIRPHMKWVVGLVIAYGPFNLPQGCVCVYICMG